MRNGDRPLEGFCGVKAMLIGVDVSYVCAVPVVHGVLADLCTCKPLLHCHGFGLGLVFLALGAFQNSAEKITRCIFC